MSENKGKCEVQKVSSVCKVNTKTQTTAQAKGLWVSPSRSLNASTSPLSREKLFCDMSHACLIPSAPHTPPLLLACVIGLQWSTAADEVLWQNTRYTNKRNYIIYSFLWVSDNTTLWHGLLTVQCMYINMQPFLFLLFLSGVWPDMYMYIFFFPGWRL